MTRDLQLSVAGVGIWLPGVPNREAWIAGARGNASRDEPFEAASGASIERRARRRASKMSRALADAYTDAVTQAGVDPGVVASVFGSGLGEVTTMLGVLDQMSRGEELSPMAFATSVHSATSGVVSISAKNRGFTTAISAYHDTVGAAIFEAMGLLATHRVPVVIACADENSPDRFVEGDEAFDTVTAALVLVPDGHDGPILGKLSAPFVGEPTVAAADVPAPMGRNPQIGLVDLVSAILSRSSGIVGLDRGRASRWCVEVSPA